MSLMNSLLKTYDFALNNDLVDNHQISESGQVLLPIYHSNKRSSGEDIFEITIDNNSNAIRGRFLDKDEIVVFPISEDSITRSGAKIAPHPICDELSYLSKEIDENKNKAYLEGVIDLLDFENKNNYKHFRLIGEYIKKNKVIADFLKYYLGRTEYKIDDKFNLKYEIMETNGKAKTKSINLSKVFITFKIERILEGDISLTRDSDIHKFYIKYVMDKNKDKKEIATCDVTGKNSYCIERHRGLLGTAKLISISNNNETYYGRFKNGGDISHISYEASQKVHNMLKYFLDNTRYRRYIGENAYVVNWLSQDLDKGGIELISNLDNIDYLDDDIEEVTISDLGDKVSEKLGNYFSGENNNFDSKGDFYILIIEKISNGRVSIKYFRRLLRSEAYERVMNWYKSTNWKFYNEYKSPSIYQIVNFLYGQENSKGYLSCENKKLTRSAIERLLPCVIDSKKLPKDIVTTTFNKLSNRMSYKKTWNTALNIGCSLIKKYKYDHEGYDINPDNISEVKQLKENKSFYYGKLIAIYEKIELDAIRGRTIEDANKGKVNTQRITNSDRLWNSMIRAPERTRFILESKIKPYMNILKKNNPGSYVFFDKLITSITLELMELKESSNKEKNSLNEDFILGYYYQKDSFYKKRDKSTEI